MDSVFVSVLTMSLQASMAVLVVILLRLVLRKAPKAIIAALWALVAVRLLCPFAPESAVSLMPHVELADMELSLPAMGDVSVPLTEPTQPVDTQWLLTGAAILWLAGAAALTVYTLYNYGCIRKTLREAVRLHGDLYACDRIPTPFILGVFHPRIYVPSSMSERDLQYVLAHENAHLARRDHWWKPLGFVLLTVHWFNPLMWLAYRLFCRDMEMACDEKVIASLGSDSKKPYSDALINCSAPTTRIAACPLAFGETDVKLRVRSVLRYKKPAVVITATALAVCALAALCLLTDPSVQALGVVDNTPASDTTAPSAVTTTTAPVTVPTEPTLPRYTQDMAIEAITPRAVKAGEQVTVRVYVKDTRGIESGVEVLLYRETDDGVFVSVGDAVRLTLVSGTASDGVYEGTVAIPVGTATGDYRLRATYIPVSQKPAVCTAYTPEGEAAVTVIM